MTQTAPAPAKAPTTQTKHPWRATARTVFAGVVGALTLLPEVAAAAHIGTVPTVVQILAVTGAITRVLALPGVEAWLGRYVPWLAAAPNQPVAAPSQPASTPSQPASK
ncbi:hypothetical protein GCM10023322_59090 [Rugosimonospora acidiphila]|uniref:Holin n=1 Tax=Rugosimonospora acidiphila TaxID=556531 RepID=A0ABP9SGI0_9ACTN